MADEKPKAAGGAPKRPTHAVAHAKLYLRVNGKLQHVPKGTPLVLSKEQAEAGGKMFASVGSGGALDMTDKADKAE